MKAESSLESLYSAAREHRYADAENLMSSAKLSKEDRCDWFIRAVIEGQKEAAKIILHNGSTQKEEPLINLTSFLNNVDEIEDEMGLTAEESKAEVVAVLIEKISKSDAIFPAPIFLDFAISEGNSKLVDVLLSSSIDALAKEADVYSSNDISTLLHGAVWNGDAVKVASLLKSGASPEDSDMLMAVEKGFLHVIECLIDAGANANAQFRSVDKNERDPVREKLIQFRHCRSRPRDVRFLYSSRCRSDKRQNKTLLHVAAEKGYEVIVKLLINKDAEINVYNSDGRTPLFLAARNCHESVIALLLEYGAERDSVDDDDLSALHYFAAGGCVESADMLLKYGISVDSTNSAERTPLHLAAIFGQTKMASLLLEHGAHIDARDTRGETPLHDAVEEGHLGVSQMLLDFGASVEAKNDAGEVALHLAAFRGREAIIKLLLEYGASVDAKIQPSNLQFPPERRRDWTPLLISVEEGHLRAAKVLVRSGASIDVTDLNRRTMLHIGADMGNFEVVSLLLDFGVNTDVKDEDGVTALLLAVCRLESQFGYVRYEDPSPSHLKIIEALLRFGADVHLTDNQNRTPLSVAAYRQWMPTGLRVLLEYGSPSHFVNEATAYSLFKYVNESEATFTHWHPPPRRDRRKGYYSMHYKKKGVSTSEILVRHVVKMRAAELYLGEEYFFAKEFCDENEIDAFRQECEVEVEMMKLLKIGESDVSYHDFLTKNIHRLQPIISSEDILQTFSSCSYFDTFPIYAAILKNHFEKARIRQKFLEGITSFHFLLNRIHRVPYEIAELIANRYLSNSDLRKLMSIRLKVRSRKSSENVD